MKHTKVYMLLIGPELAGQHQGSDVLLTGVVDVDERTQVHEYVQFVGQNGSVKQALLVAVPRAEVGSQLDQVLDEVLFSSPARTGKRPGTRE